MPAYGSVGFLCLSQGESSVIGQNELVLIAYTPRPITSLYNVLYILQKFNILSLYTFNKLKYNVLMN